MLPNNVLHIFEFFQGHPNPPPPPPPPVHALDLNQHLLTFTTLKIEDAGPGFLERIIPLLMEIGLV